MKEVKKHSSIYLTDEIKRQVKEHAIATERTTNAMIIVMIKEYLERNK